MRRIAVVSTVAGLLLGASHAASVAQSAIVDMTRQTGPSKFVTNADGKPVRLGDPAQGTAREEPHLVIIVSPPAAAGQGELPADPALSDGSQDKPPPEKQADNQPRANRPRANPPAADQPPSGQPGSDQPASDSETPSATGAASACEPDCDDDP